MCSERSARARWVDRACVERSVAGEARGRRRSHVRRARQGRDPGEERRTIALGVGRGKTMLFDGEACAKGTAWLPIREMLRCGFLGRNAQRVEVAVEVEPASFRMIARAWSSRDGARLPRQTFDVRPPNPKSGAKAEMFSRSRVWSKTPKSSKRQRRNRPELGARRARCSSESSSVRADAARGGNAEGERNLMRGGSTYWARPGRYGPSWMSTGRPRVIR